VFENFIQFYYSVCTKCQLWCVTLGNECILNIVHHMVLVYNLVVFHQWLCYICDIITELDIDFWVTGWQANYFSWFFIFVIILEGFMAVIISINSRTTLVTC